MNKDGGDERLQESIEGARSTTYYQGLGLKAFFAGQKLTFNLWTT